MKKSLKGYDIDGVLTSGVVPVGDFIIISGRTFAEYDDFAKTAAQIAPVYIRGVGEYGDRKHAGRFKAKMIKMLGVTEFFEDDPLQAKIIHDTNKQCKVNLV